MTKRVIIPSSVLKLINRGVMRVAIFAPERDCDTLKPVADVPDWQVQLLASEIRSLYVAGSISITDANSILNQIECLDISSDPHFAVFDVGKQFSSVMYGR